ncbi:OsmC family protein [Nitrospira sp. Nam80]
MNWADLCRSADRFLLRSIIRHQHNQGGQGRTAPFVVETAEPPVLLGDDQAPNPAEFVLHALAACLTTSLVYHAAARGIHIESLELRLEGDLDLQGFLGLSNDVRKGFRQVRATFTVKSDDGKEQLEEVTKFSPVYDAIAIPVAVAVSVEKV